MNADLLELQQSVRQVLAGRAVAAAPQPALANTGAGVPAAGPAPGPVAVLGGVVAVVTVSRRRRTA